MESRMDSHVASLALALVAKQYPDVPVATRDMRVNRQASATSAIANLPDSSLLGLIGFWRIELVHLRGDLTEDAEQLSTLRALPFLEALHVNSDVQSSSLRGLTALRELHVYGEISGVVPSDLTQLTRLCILWGSNEARQNLGHVTGLRTLYLQQGPTDPAFDKRTWDNIQQLTRLTYLGINESFTDGETRLVEAVRVMTALRELNYWGNGSVVFDGLDFEHLSLLKLRLVRSRMTSIWRLRALRDLRLVTPLDTLTDANENSIEGATGLTFLHLFTPLHPDFVRHLAALTDLRHLSIANRHLSADTVCQISSLPNMSSLLHGVIASHQNRNVWDESPAAFL